MGRVISITVSSWAWDHGQTGDMATGGVVIGSAGAAEEDMSLAEATVVTALTRPTADAVRERTLAALAASEPPRRVVALPMVLLMQPRMVQRPTVAGRMAVANVASLS
ncbi:MAG: hypothetical protein WCC37_09590 [Candidatus Sulfotelmatobacter sp.]